MPIEEKTAKIIDLNLFSGSSDTMRTNLGGFWKIEPMADAESGEEVIWDEFVYYDLSNPFFDRTYRSGLDASQVSEDVAIPTFKFPVRLYGKASQVKNDSHWKVIFMGGEYADISYPTIYNESVWDDYWFETGLPYAKQEVNTLIRASEVTSVSQISYDYNHYLKEYQDYVANIDSELLIPNMYLVEMFNGVDSTDVGTAQLEEIDFLTETETPSPFNKRVFDQSLHDFVSLDGAIGSLDILLSDVNTCWVPAPAPSIGFPETTKCDVAYEGLPDHALHSYLNQSLPLIDLGVSTQENAEKMLQNIYFDQYSRTAGTPKHTFDDMENTKSLFPYYININFPAREAADTFSEDVTGLVSLIPETYFVQSIEGNNYSSKFLKSLKEVFNNEAPSLAPETKEYVLSLDYQSASIGAVTDSTVKSAQNTPLRTVDYFKLLTYAYENYASTTDNEYFVGEKTIHREAAIDKTGVYRYINSDGALGVMEDALEFVSEGTDFGNYFKVDSLSDLYNFDDKYNEILAYRIEKIGGPPTGDSQTQNVLQNYWIINSSFLTEDTDLLNLNFTDINFFDSQVKYDKDYTYNIYAYVLSVGVKYQTTDLRITRIVNDILAESGKWCVEFYDPETGLAADQLWEAPPEPVEGETEKPASLLTVPEEGDPVTPYLADFYVNVEPSLQVFEVPIATKTLRVLDNPPNQPAVKPFQLVDASQTIGYDIEYETFAEESYPTTISSADAALKFEYLNARDLLEEDIINFESVSQQRYIQVYRISKMPKEFEDFDNNLISTIDLKIKDSGFNLSYAIFYDMIKTNHKYYYVFRVLNENLIPGHLSEIYEAELIDDGGYVYSNFDILFEEDLREDIFTNPSIPFKKLIQLQPNMSQISFNDNTVDYEDTAQGQLDKMTLGNVDDLIWDRTFKIRLTSKKTGKKIDLNVTYKYERDSN